MCVGSWVMFGLMVHFWWRPAAGRVRALYALFNAGLVAELVVQACAGLMTEHFSCRMEFELVGQC